jgi:transglutaminase-like putative cysteine protease
MKYTISHDTHYTFSGPVFPEPHYLRLRPQVTPHQRVDAFALHISPTPTGISHLRDGENNLVDFCWFDGEHHHLRIRAASIVTIKDHNPFHFILYPDTALTLPFSYTDQQQQVLQPALVPAPIGPELLAYGQRLLAETDFQTTIFLTEITRRIQADFTSVYRETGAPFSPDQTFADRVGSCRDLSWMLIHLLRTMGLAARFVSGYNYIDADDPEFELHAWVEVFLPGAGWVGFDPTHGLVAGMAHIPLAASADFANTMPVSGAIRGEAQAALTTTLVIERSLH